MTAVDTSFLNAWNPASSGGNSGGGAVQGFYDILDNGLGAWVELEKIKHQNEGSADRQDDTRNTITGERGPVVDTSYLPEFTRGLNQGNAGAWLLLGAVGLGVYLLVK